MLLAQAIDKAVEFARAHSNEMNRAEVDEFKRLAEHIYHLAYRAGLVHALPQVDELLPQLESNDLPLRPVFESKLNLPGDWEMVQPKEGSDNSPLPSMYRLFDDLPKTPEREYVFLVCATPRWFDDMATLCGLAETHEPPDRLPSELQPSSESLSNNEYTILCELRDALPKLLVLPEVEANTSLTRKTCGEIIKSLVQRGLADRPNGQRKGATITPAGEKLLNAR